jgi:hypothetical protein
MTGNGRRFGSHLFSRADESGNWREKAPLEGGAKFRETNGTTKAYPKAYPKA